MALPTVDDLSERLCFCLVAPCFLLREIFVLGPPCAGHERDLLVSSLEALVALLRPSPQPLGTSTLGCIISSSPGSWASLLLEPKESLQDLLLRLAKGHLGGGSEKSSLLSWEALRAASVTSAAHPAIVGCEGAVQLVMRHALMPRLAITECTAMGRWGFACARQ